jgi:twitching motility protein PilT
VFATLHTQDAPQTIDRIIDVFPPHQQQQVRVQLAATLQGVVTQQLLQTADGQGRVVATEVLVCTPAVRNIIREGKVHQIYSIMQAGGSDAGGGPGARRPAEGRHHPTARVQALDPEEPPCRRGGVA